jgi:hypothetical protein
MFVVLSTYNVLHDLCLRCYSQPHCQIDDDDGCGRDEKGPLLDGCAHSRRDSMVAAEQRDRLINRLCFNRRTHAGVNIGRLHDEMLRPHVGLQIVVRLGSMHYSVDRDRR